MSLCGIIPPEILTDILSRLPVKLLCRFKCVSPSWNSLISDAYFAKTHLNRTNTQNPKYLDQRNIVISSSLNLYFIDFGDANPTATELDFPTVEQHAADKRVKVWSSCDGLRLVSYDDNFNFFLLNPSTRECKKLPAPPFVLNPVGTCWYAYGVGYDSSTDDYNVVRLSAQSNISIVDVYSLKNNAWRTIQDFHYRPVGRGRGVCFYERIHWLCWRTGGLDYSKVVVAFNLADEIFREVQLPSLYDDNEFRGHDMVALEGCLCLLVWSKSDRIDVWMMMEYGVRESWTTFFSIANPGRSIMHVLCLSAQDELVLRRERFTSIRGRVEDEFDGEKLILCNPKEGTRREVVISGIPTTSLVGNHYIETLGSPNHGGRISETM